MSRILRSRLLALSSRRFSSSPLRTAFATGPAPPRLPSKEQEEFERLQRSSTGAFSTPKQPTPSNQSPSSAAKSPPHINQSPASIAELKKDEKAGSDVKLAAINAKVEASGTGEELHPDIRRGAKPEFEGDVNPLTGEVGGPKNEPLRWGSTGERGDWSYNGRVTDF